MLVLLTGALLIVDGYIAAKHRHQERMDQTKERLQGAVTRIVDQQYEFVAAARQLLTVLTTIAPHIDVCDQKMPIFGSQPPWLRRISLADTKGDVLCSTGGLLHPTNIADRSYFHKVMRTRRFALSEYMLGRVRDEPIILAAAPRLDERGEVSAVVVTAIDMGFIAAITARLDAGEHAEALFVDAAGTVAAASPNSRYPVGTSVSDREFMKTLEAKPGVVADIVEPGGKRRFYAGAELMDTGARLVIDFPQERLTSQLRDAAAFELGAKALFVFALLAFFWSAAERLILRPIRQLTTATRRLGGGDLSARVDTGSMTPEFAALAETFNNLAERLASKEAEVAGQTRALEHSNAQLTTLASRDELTGLANRRLLAAHMQRAMAAGGEIGNALLIIDLDHFKPVNDVFGHPAGDIVLSETANRLRNICEEEDIVARLGGDEFAILLSPRSTPHLHAQDIAERACEVLAAEFATPQGLIRIGCTVGIAVAGIDGRTPDELLRAADVAMYRAKQAGRGSHRFFQPEMYAELQARIALEGDLRDAIPRGEIVPYYQPIVDLGDGSILGLEVLARWHHPTKGVIAPGVFIPIIADMGLSDAMTQGLLAAVCDDAREWPPDIALSINLSPNQLCDATLPDRLDRIVKDKGLDIARFEIEVIEDALAHDFTTVRDSIRQFRNLGMSIALDDFGTGYSSLQHLHEIRFDKLKIDRSFIRDIREHGDAQQLVVSILGLARSMGLGVVAEGIEARADVDRLLDLGCTMGQGYFFGRPASASEVEKKIGARGSAASALNRPSLNRQDQT